jgi:hypothetical protein
MESWTDPKTGIRLARTPLGSCATGRFHVRTSSCGTRLLYWHGKLTSLGIFSRDLASLIDLRHLAQ